MRPDDAAAAPALGAALRRRQEQIADALAHYQIAYDTAWLEPRLAPMIDWRFVSRRMAEALGWTPPGTAGGEAA